MPWEQLWNLYSVHCSITQVTQQVTSDRNWFNTYVLVQWRIQDLRGRGVLGLAFPPPRQIQDLVGGGTGYLKHGSGPRRPLNNLIQIQYRSGSQTLPRDVYGGLRASTSCRSEHVL